MTVYLKPTRFYWRDRVFGGKLETQCQIYICVVTKNFDHVSNDIMPVQVMQHFMAEIDSQLTEDKLYHTLRKEVAWVNE